VAELNGTSSKFVGSSSPEIDVAWNALFKGKSRNRKACNYLTGSTIAGYWVDLTGQEAASVIGKAKALGDGFYITGLDVFHQLHCLVSASRWRNLKCAEITAKWCFYLFEALTGHLIQNSLRRTLNEFYDGRESPSSPRVHIGIIMIDFINRSPLKY
jgi:hypothetical protein